MRGLAGQWKEGVRSLADGWQIRMILQAFLAWDSIVGRIDNVVFGNSIENWRPPGRVEFKTLWCNSITFKRLYVVSILDLDTIDISQTDTWHGLIMGLRCKNNSGIQQLPRTRLRSLFMFWSLYELWVPIYDRMIYCSSHTIFFCMFCSLYELWIPI